MKQTLKYILSVVMENLKYAESKHAISIALATGIIIFASTNLEGANFLGTIFAGLSILFCSISIILSFIALMSRNIKILRKKRITKISDLNLIYFKDISEFGAMNYLEAIIKYYDFPNDYKPDEFEFDIAEQILMNAKVTNIKFNFFNKSIQWLAVGIFFIIIMVFIVSLGVE
ncbi:MAG: hypothetical protein PHC46_04235 [Clostridia bacterium]|nr:hypothetical protein [Clostridia bacterium]